MPQPQATPATPEQLKYIKRWATHGYTFGRNEVIPSDIEVHPDAWSLPSCTALAVTAVMLVVVFGILKVAA